MADEAKTAPQAPVTPPTQSDAKPMTPETTDVPPMYFAIVSPDDPNAVMDLVAMVPKSATSNEPTAYRREDKQWVMDEQIVRDLKSATPPPVVPLDATILNDILQQVDGLAKVTASGAIIASLLSEPPLEFDDYSPFDELSAEDYELLEKEGLLEDFAIQAAGGWDRNRGNAEKLRRYWAHGKGAAKIRWGTPGDWSRCVRHLSKYMGPRAKGYCQLRHKEALGYYTATHAKLDRKRNFSEIEMSEFSTQVSEQDMSLSIEQIQNTPDSTFDSTWTPNAEMENLMSQGDWDDSITAAGGFDRNRGNAEELRRYWTRGEGALKIRWGTPGDWKRCVRHLSKYLGPRAKGYCQLRHKEVTGVYTGSKLNPGKRNSMNDVFSERVIEQAVLNAKVNEIRSRFALTAAGEPDTAIQGGYGAKFSIPLVLPEDMESGDGRKFKPESVEIRELPLPLMWQYKTGDGHSGSVVVGRIDYMERIEGGIGNAHGVFDTGPYGKEAERLVRNGFLRGISADLDKFEAKEDKSSENGAEAADELGKNKLTINKARVMGVTIVPKPAFQECVITIIDGPDMPEEEEQVIPKDGIYEESVEGNLEPAGNALTASGFLSHPIPVTPPEMWFSNPKLDKPTPLTVDDSGRVYGHIAAWHVNHIGLPNNTKPPRSRSNYSYFHTGVCRTDTGKDVPVGQLTLAGGHASLRADAAAAAKHYDDTASAVADVHAGEDRYGIWVAGALRPDVTEAQIRALRASAPSGDWRPIGGSLELVAVCQVNVPGFPIARALVASGEVVALVAAGAYEMAMLRLDHAGKLSMKSRLLGELSAGVESLNISERIEAKRLDMEFGYMSRDERMKLAEKGHALPNGSYPISSVSDLRNAIQAYGRSKESDRAKVRRHIIKRAGQLKARHLIPEEWKNASTAEATAALSTMREKISALTAAIPTPVEVPDQLVEKVKTAKEQAEAEQKIEQDAIEQRKQDMARGQYDPEAGRFKYTAKTQPRDSRGKFRKVLARLKQDLGVAGLQSVLKKVEATENMEFAGNYAQADSSANELIGLIDRLDSGALDATKLENVRSTARELGKVIANLPLPFTNQAQKIRYSDLPPTMKNLIDDMIVRVEKKIGKKDADIATAQLRSFKSGADLYSQSEISSRLATLLRLLT